MPDEEAPTPEDWERAKTFAQTCHLFVKDIISLIERDPLAYTGGQTLGLAQRMCPYQPFGPKTGDEDLPLCMHQENWGREALCMIETETDRLTADVLNDQEDFIRRRQNLTRLHFYTTQFLTITRTRYKRVCHLLGWKHPTDFDRGLALAESFLHIPKYRERRGKQKVTRSRTAKHQKNQPRKGTTTKPRNSENIDLIDAGRPVMDASTYDYSIDCLLKDRVGAQAILASMKDRVRRGETIVQDFAYCQMAGLCNLLHRMSRDVNQESSPTPVLEYEEPNLFAELAERLKEMIRQATGHRKDAVATIKWAPDEFSLYTKGENQEPE